MKFLKAVEKEPGKREFVFQVNKREREYLQLTLSIYSLMDLNLQPLSRSGDHAEEQQELLRESMVDLRRSRRKKLESLSKLFTSKSHGYHLTLCGEDIEWLLQVLNEIRIGCWINLGRPELQESEGNRQLNPEESRYRMFMELSGFFQMHLLQAFEK